MKRTLGGRDVWVAVISTGRPQAEESMTALIGSATWYVRESDEYPVAAFRRVAAAGVSRARNAALDDAHERGLPCVQFSDDLTRIAVYEEGKAAPATMRRVVGAALDALDETGAFLAGGPPTANPFYSGGWTIKTAAFIVGDFMIVRPCEQRFDESLWLKEDYDYTLQHLDAHGRVARHEALLLTFKHRTNPGGAVDTRTRATEQDSIAKLRARWGDAIRDNPRRPDEITLDTSRWK